MVLFVGLTMFFIFILKVLLDCSKRKQSYHGLEAVMCLSDLHLSTTRCWPWHLFARGRPQVSQWHSMDTFGLWNMFHYILFLPDSHFWLITKPRSFGCGVRHSPGHQRPPCCLRYVVLPFVVLPLIYLTVTHFRKPLSEPNPHVALSTNWGKSNVGDWSRSLQTEPNL